MLTSNLQLMTTGTPYTLARIQQEMAQSPDWKETERDALVIKQRKNIFALIGILNQIYLRLRFFIIENLHMA